MNYPLLSDFLYPEYYTNIKQCGLNAIIKNTKYTFIVPRGFERREYHFLYNFSWKLENIVVRNITKVTFMISSKILYEWTGVKEAILPFTENDPFPLVLYDFNELSLNVFVNGHTEIGNNVGYKGPANFMNNELKFDKEPRVDIRYTVASDYNFNSDDIYRIKLGNVTFINTKNGLYQI